MCGWKHLVLRHMLLSLLMELKGKSMTMGIVCVSQKTLLNADSVPKDACFITISTRIYISNPARALKLNCMPVFYSPRVSLAEEMVQTPFLPSFRADVTSLTGDLPLMHFFLLSGCYREWDGRGGKQRNDYFLTLCSF